MGVGSLEAGVTGVCEALGTKFLFLLDPHVSLTTHRTISPASLPINFGRHLWTSQEMLVPGEQLSLRYGYWQVSESVHCRQPFPVACKAALSSTAWSFWSCSQWRLL